jgi:hypothetical protein
MRRFALSLLLILALVSAASGQGQPLVTHWGAHITTATTTTLVAAVTGGTIGVWSFSACVAAGGTQTTITLQDGAGTNLIGTSVTYPLQPGTCYVAPFRGRQWFTSTASGQALQIVTSDIGPVDVYVEVVK